ncbi:MAG: Fic family protein, partial [Chloroflexi bacterium]|nr:Fic family protein [Chloroflexota bacterium]
SPSGRLVRTVDPQGRDYMAFVPHPLPPPLEYDIELVAALSEADRALGELAGLGRNLPNPQLLIQPFIHREAVLSSRIEGTQTDIAGLYAYEVGQPPPPGTPTTATMADALEVHNYVVALEYGLQRMETLPVSQRLICEVHQLLMQGVRGDRATPGVYRRMQNFIGTPGDTAQSAVYVPPPVSEMHDALDSFEKYLHERDEHPPLVRLAFTHYQFESIHPFLGLL